MNSPAAISRQRPVPRQLLSEALVDAAQIVFPRRGAAGARAYEISQCEAAIDAVNQPSGKRGAAVVSRAEFKAATERVQDLGGKAVLFWAYHDAHAAFNAKSKG